MAGQHTFDDQPLLLANLPPSTEQRRLALAIIVVFYLIFAVTIPFANTPLPRLDAWIPMFAAILVVNGLVTAALLISQFSIARQRAVLALATGYLFSGLTIIPYALTFPGLFSPTGLLGAGVQSAVWLYLVWHVVSPASVIAYALLKDKKANVPERLVRTYILWGVAAVVTVVCVLFWLVTKQHELLPRIYLDKSSLSPLAIVAASAVAATCVIALALLWFRRTSVLDLWLMVTVFAWLLEITLQGILLTDRFSFAWYMGRVFSLTASAVVMIVLLAETTILYAHLARSVIRQRSARQARQVAMDTMAASIAHEVNQPLGSIILNAEAALAHLGRSPPDTNEIRAALQDISSSSARAGQVISSLRTMFKKETRGRVSFDVNELIREVLAILEVDLRAQRVSISTALQEDLPNLFADRGQFQQVFLNLLVNAIEAMRPVRDRRHELRVTSRIDREAGEISIAVEDSGTGINQANKSSVFEPFYTTKSGGMGIGLTICRSIVEAHGGSLRASANDPHGATFEVAVPVDQA